MLVLKMRSVRRLLLLLALALTGTATLPAQSDSLAPSRLTTRAWLLGVGRVNRLDTYLSPLEYTGPELHVVRETMRPTRWLDGRISTQRLVVAGVAYTHSPTDDGKAWSGQIDGTWGYHYNWRPAPGLRLMAGAQAAGGLGFQYHTRNGNNPAQARADVALSASLLAVYKFRLGRWPMTARVQADAPLLGAMFTPHYGQSYYELFSLGHYDRNVRFTHPGNAPSMRWLATLDVPLGRAVVRVGYLCDIRQSDVNHLKRHAWSHALLVGYVRHFTLIRPADRRRADMIY